MRAETRKKYLSDKGPWTMNIEDVWPGDEVKSHGIVSSILNRVGSRFVRLIFTDGRVLQDYYGKKVTVTRLSDRPFYGD
ncbi:hypothetical protein [Mahella australiensis]|uniref:Uncharacterized protein n=1 Tax=Mahella australiensis (strain DSM 15567 / CIP 107919 / 50-1 BON) TaxID=697281 RepID=F4A0X5_MAHA5|nr:hypothetical protein [Mahella australiensis]AEE98052.1 hypothetical protein Mahau_2931 [Mahella australiensis 50-1 BON]